MSESTPLTVELYTRVLARMEAAESKVQEQSKEIERLCDELDGEMLAVAKATVMLQARFDGMQERMRLAENVIYWLQILFGNGCIEENNDQPLSNALELYEQECEAQKRKVSSSSSGCPRMGGTDMTKTIRGGGDQ